MSVVAPIARIAALAQEDADEADQDYFRSCMMLSNATNTTATRCATKLTTKAPNPDPNPSPNPNPDPNHQGTGRCSKRIFWQTNREDDESRRRYEATRGCIELQGHVGLHRQQVRTRRCGYQAQTARGYRCLLSRGVCTPDSPQIRKSGIILFTRQSMANNGW